MGYGCEMTKHFPDTAFWAAYQGRFSGVLNWPDVEAFWASMAASSGGWFVFGTEQVAPDATATAAEFAETLGKATELINTRRDRSHCGAIYVDDIQSPTFIKIFDPAAMGSACNISGIPVLPRWIISRIKPDNVPPPPPPENLSLFKRLTRGA